MSIEQLSVLVTLLVQTGAFFWWGATISQTVKHHERELADHEERLRKGEL